MRWRGLDWRCSCGADRSAALCCAAHHLRRPPVLSSGFPVLLTFRGRPRPVPVFSGESFSTPVGGTAQGLSRSFSEILCSSTGRAPLSPALDGLSTGISTTKPTASAPGCEGGQVPSRARPHADAAMAAAVSARGAAEPGATLPKAGLGSAPLGAVAGADRGDEGRDDLLEVADDRVVGVRDDRRVRVGIDGDDVLRAQAAGHVLDRATDPAGEVQFRRYPGACLADLLLVRSPALAGDDAGNAHDTAEQPGQLLEGAEPVRPADAAPAADHHPRR